ncbi:hypothetical protein BU24DRAFT_403715 [Aaosphaeria arxii CBS 175.79]|uniref:Uncharacterized protein n=1 Tax=Aaosphaeria arxii CBS 175.79 TaxID=1450172 RepID=A0A6A5Y5R5_9PLEO|nr:uncharacterized protein BU24DRAFT_403715 [Aaosphaeria arxii CBS 175.79]KAF2020619.1 hypothetical protein BU24DRAFT_403715 [Aaosphaeria arxii CBS 175.79]
MSQTDYLPWSWTIQSKNSDDHACPSESSLLGTFAAVNGIVSLLAVIFGHRIVVKKLTCGWCGERGSRSWQYMWIVPVGLQLAANAIIAWLIKRSDGYIADFKVSELMLFLVARPRLGWVVLGAFALRSRKIRQNETNRARQNRTPNRNQYLSPQSPPQSSWPPSPFGPSSPPSPYGSDTALLYPYNTSRRSVDRQDASFFPPTASSTHLSDYPWWSAFMTQFIGEFMLQIITLYIMGITAKFATTNGYYKIHKKSYWGINPAARMMYSGALYYLVAGSLFLLVAAIFIIYTVSSERTRLLGRGSKAFVAWTLAFLMISTWLGSWIFWTGFVRLSGRFYCPPKVIEQGVIWTFFSTIGIIFGTGV